MASRLFEDFEERFQEVSKFLSGMKNLEQGCIQLAMGNSRNQKIKKIDYDLEKTLKQQATCCYTT